MTFRYHHGDRPLEGYTILRGIGRGGFGEVYYAVSDGGREVALKVVQQNHDIELRGIQHCINLKNPHLVSIFDVKTSADGYPFVIMEYVAGPSLRDLLREAPRGLGVEKAVYLVREIAKGLTYLHDRGIVHRDLKPENIFYEDGYVKIGDYGLSKYISVSRQSGQTISVGTVHYMAPEIGSGNYHHCIDLYALGIIFFELMTGQVPFNGDSMGEILMKHLTCEPDLSAVEEGLRPVVAKAMAKDPKARYGSASEMVEAILASSDVARRVAGFNPASLGTLSVRPPRDGIPSPPVQGPPVRAAIAPKASPRAEVPPPLPASPRMLEPTESPVAESKPGFWSREVEQRLGHAGLTIFAMTFALSLFGGMGRAPFAAFAFTIAGLSAAICFLDAVLAPRLAIGLGISRRLATFGVGVPVLALAGGLFRLPENLVFALLAALVFVDWHQRARPTRRERVSFEYAFTAGLFGLIAGAVTQTNLLASAGLTAAVSLTVGALSIHAPELRRNGRRAKGLSPRVAVPSAAPPRPAVTPSAAFAPVAPEPAAVSIVGSDGKPRLLRSSSDSMVAGVCSGLARRYGIEVVWLRVGFLLAALAGFGTGVALYVVLWICMPSDERILRTAASRRPSGPSVAHVLTALFVLGLTALSVIFGFIWVQERPPYFQDREVSAVVGGLFFFSAALFGLFSAVFILSGRSRPGGIWRPLLSTGLLLLGVFLCTVAVFCLGTPPTFLRDPDLARTSGASVCAASAIAAFVLGAVLRRGGPRGETAQTSPGWAALGILLVVLSLVPMALSVLLASDPGQTLLRDLYREVPAAQRWISGLGSLGGALLVAFILFLPGVLCLLFARRVGGPAHVLRGAVGWALLAMVLVSLARSAPALFHDRPPMEGVALGPLAIGLFVLGVGSFLLLAWPRRRATRAGEGEAMVSESSELARKP